MRAGEPSFDSQQAAEKSIMGGIGSMRLAENKEHGEVNSPLQKPLRTFFSNLLV
jgi:hypothetical protein